MNQIRERLLSLRLLLILFGLVAFLATLYLGSTGTVSVQYAENVSKQIGSSCPTPPNQTLWNLTPCIFENNFKISLLGFIPFIFGSILLLLIGYNTGLAFSGQGLLMHPPVSGPLLLFSIMLLPFFFWELAGYALSMMEGLIITRGLLKHDRVERFIAPGHFRDGELFKALMVLMLTVLILFLAALTESYLIVNRI